MQVAFFCKGHSTCLNARPVLTSFGLYFTHVCKCNINSSQNPQTLKHRHHSLLLRRPKRRRPGGTLTGCPSCSISAQRAWSLMTDSGTATCDGRAPGSGSPVLSGGIDIMNNLWDIFGFMQSKSFTATYLFRLVKTCRLGLDIMKERHGNKHCYLHGRCGVSCQILEAAWSCSGSKCLWQVP